MLIVAILMVERNEPRLWVAFGALAGIALENKHTVVLLAIGIVVGLALAPERRLLCTRWLVVGGVVALVLFLPNLLWQIENGFPSLEFYRNATLFKNRPLPSAPGRVESDPLHEPLHVSRLGVRALLLSPSQTRVRVRRARIPPSARDARRVPVESAGRITGLYPALFACGAVQLERFVRSVRIRALVLAGIVAGSAVLGVVSLPVLPPESVSRFVGFLGIDTQIERGAGKRAELPQWLADRFGWEELVDQVTAVYDSLTTEEKARAVILAPSYGHAGALELFGRGRLPPVMSPHNTYHLWGRDDVQLLEGDILISIGYDAEDIGAMYESIEQVAVYDCDYCMTWRDQMPIFLARGLKIAGSELGAAWEAAKHYEKLNG